MTKTHHLNSQKSSLTHRQHIKTHRKKFADILEESNSPFFSPYDSMTAPHFTSPSFHGPLSTTTTKQKTETTLKTVVNLSDAQLSPTELECPQPRIEVCPHSQTRPHSSTTPSHPECSETPPRRNGILCHSPDNHHPCRLQSQTRQDS